MSLQIKNLSKRFDSKWVLKDVSLEARRGEIFGVLGENGIGKTVLLRAVGGNETASGGSIFLDGDDLTKTTTRGFLSNEKASGGRWNLFGAKTKLCESAEKSKEISVAVLTAKNVVLLDNPFSFLDERAKEEACAELRKIVAERQLIVLIATNDSNLAFALCDRVGVLHNGEIIQEGTPREIYENPRSVAAAQALGANNLILARRVTFNNENSLEFQTLTGDHRLQVDKTDKRKLGAITNNVTLAIRPEHISISFGASFPEDNLLKAKIVGVQYFGATTRLKLDANGLILEALALRIVGLSIGDECMVGLPPDRVLVLKD